jgi:cysteine synthase
MSQGAPRVFLDAIDHRWEASESVVLRYRHTMQLESDEENDHRLKALFEKTSVREGVRVVPFFPYRGVEIDVLDETSLMETRTLKSIDGCVTTAQCLLRNYRSVVFESGGNTGTALTVYASRAGLETFFFVPAENLSLLDGRFFENDLTHVVAVSHPRDVKPAAELFAARRRLPRIPELGWRIQASTFVGCFLFEHLLDHGPYDVLAQSISAAFGPVGIYRVLAPERHRLGRLPSFLGVQQASNCPMVRAWKGSGAEPVASTADLLARVMYDGQPGTYGTLEPLRRILTETEGDLATVDRQAFDRGLATIVDGKNVLEHLADRKIEITLRDGDVLEKAGLMALVGTLREIERGAIAKGSRALVCITGGTARPEAPVRATRWSDADGLESVGRRPTAEFHGV